MNKLYGNDWLMRSAPMKSDMHKPDETSLSRLEHTLIVLGRSLPWVLAVLIFGTILAGSIEALWNLPRLTALFEITSMIQTSLGVAFTASLIGGVTSVGLALQLVIHPNRYIRRIIAWTVDTLAMTPAIVIVVLLSVLIFSWFPKDIESFGFAYTSMAGFIVGLTTVPAATAQLYRLFRNQDEHYINALIALGADRYDILFHAFLSFYRRQIVGTWFQIVAKALGETAVVLVVLEFTPTLSGSEHPLKTLTTFIAESSAYASTQNAQFSVAYLAVATLVTLVFICHFINVRYIRRMDR